MPNIINEHLLSCLASSRAAMRSFKKWPPKLLLGGLAILLCAGALSLHRPAASFARATVAMDHNHVEPLQYELLLLRQSEKYEPHAGLVTGALLLAEKRPDEALTYLGLAADHPDTATRSQTMAGRALYLSGRFLEAGEMWQHVLTTDPDNVDALRWLGVAYYDLGALFRASYYFEQAARQRPADGRPHAQIGSIMNELGKYPAAIQAFQESLRRDPHQPDVDRIRLQLADCHLEQHEAKKALAVLADCQTTGEVLAARARCYRNLGKTADALLLLDQAAQLGPQHFTAMILKAQILLEKDQSKEALELLERAAEIAPMDAEVQYQLMVAYKRVGMHEKAVAHKAVFDNVNKVAERYKRLKEDAVVDPRNAEIRIELGRLARRLGLLPSAGNWLRAALYLDPENASAREALIDLLRNPKETPDTG